MFITVTPLETPDTPDLKGVFEIKAPDHNPPRLLIRELIQLNATDIGLAQAITASGRYADIPREFYHQGVSAGVPVRTVAAAPAV